MSRGADWWAPLWACGRATQLDENNCRAPLQLDSSISSFSSQNWLRPVSSLFASLCLATAGRDSFYFFLFFSSSPGTYTTSHHHLLCARNLARCFNGPWQKSPQKQKTRHNKELYTTFSVKRTTERVATTAVPMWTCTTTWSSSFIRVVLLKGSAEQHARHNRSVGAWRMGPAMTSIRSSQSSNRNGKLALDWWKWEGKAFWFGRLQQQQQRKK